MTNSEIPSGPFSASVIVYIIAIYRLLITEFCIKLLQDKNSGTFSCKAFKLC